MNDLIQIIGTIFNHAINRKVIKINNPTKKIKKLVNNNQRLRYINNEEIHELFEAIQGETLELLKSKIHILKSNDYVLLDCTNINNLDSLLSKRLRPILDNLF